MIVGGILLGIGVFMLILVLALVSLEADGGEVLIFSLIGAAEVIIGILLMVSAQKKKKKQAAWDRQNQQQLAITRFCKLCDEKGVTDFSEPAQIQHALLAAKDVGIPANESNIQQIYLWCKSEMEQDKKNAQFLSAKERIKALKAEEQKTFQELTKYSRFFGQEKPIAILQEKAREIEAAIADQNKLMNFAVNNSQQKEMSWATHGGIAAGIAGGAAGLATAMDIQQKNAQIRAQNAQNLHAVAQAMPYMQKQLSKLQSKLSDVQSEMKNYGMKLVVKDEDGSIFSWLKITNLTSQVSETGSVTVEADVSTQPGLKIYDKIPAFIDGTQEADICQNNSRIGTALLVLPFEGASKEAHVKGICLNCGNPGQPCSVTVRSRLLWAMEQ